MDLGYLVPSLEIVENTIIAPKNSREETSREYFRKGDVIYYAKPENINMIRKNDNTGKTDPPDAETSIKSDRHTDTIHSGESLFKVFTFEQSSNDEDTEKCIAFWRSVMEKNLTPIKCTIIENSKNPTPPANQKQKSLEAEEEKREASSEDDVAKLHEEYRNMWLSALRDIQKKKLHEIKLNAKPRCTMCDSISSSVDEYVDKVDKQALKKEIKELNNWKSKSNKQQKRTPKGTKISSSSSLIDDTPLIKSQHSKTLTNAKQTSGESKNKKSSTSKDVTKKETSTDSIKEKIRKNLVPDTNTYIHKDVIGEKKKDGVYSKWRSNALEEVCQCNSVCSCNVNPAVVAIVEKESDSTTASDEASTESNKSDADQSKSQISMDDQHTERSYIQAGRNEIQSTSALLERKDVEKARKMRQRALSLFLRCPCSASSCDCQAQKEYLSRATDINSDWDVPKPISTPNVIRKRSSLEVYRKSFFRKEMSSEKASSSVSLNAPVPENSVSTIIGKGLRKNYKRGRAISLVLKDCRCSNEDCDCFEIETIQRNRSQADDDSIQRKHSKTDDDTIQRKHSKTDYDTIQRNHSKTGYDTIQRKHSKTGYDTIQRKHSKTDDTIQRKHSKTDDTIQRKHSKADYDAAYVRNGRMVVKRVDSLELTKTRLSTVLDPLKKWSVQILYPPSDFDDESSVSNENLT